MTRIAFEDVSFGFASPLFERLSISFEAGWTGLVGANGAGKTTLLALVAGELSPALGRVRITPPSDVVWCRQHSIDQDAAIRRFAADTSGTAQRWRGAFRLQPGEAERFTELSPGERKRWQLAAALAQDPGVLLLDEPSNHLDAGAREILCAALRKYDGVGILVSHDRALLDALTTHTARLRAQSVDVRPGNYSAASAQWELEQAATQSARETLKRDQGRMRERIDSQRRRAAAAERDRNNRRVAKDPKDHDARSILRKNKAEFAGRRLARDARALESRLGRVQGELAALHVEKQLGAEVFGRYAPWPKPLVLRARLDALYAGERRLLGPTSLDIARQDKIALQGANGCGKTSLIRELGRQNPHAFERSVYLPQSLAPEAQHELGSALSELAPDARGRVLQIVAALGSDPGAILASKRWSPGEARKVALALGLTANAPALILDEPTNHFDLPSIERLEQLLIGFPGCVLLVTHDPVLARRVASRRLRIEGTELVEHGAAQHPGAHAP